MLEAQRGGHRHGERREGVPWRREGAAWAPGHSAGQTAARASAAQGGFLRAVGQSPGHGLLDPILLPHTPAMGSRVRASPTPSFQLPIWKPGDR